LGKTGDEHLGMAAMDVTGNLLNVAEISAAFAGFATLVSVLRQRGTRADALHDAGVHGSGRVGAGDI